MAHVGAWIVVLLVSLRQLLPWAGAGKAKWIPSYAGPFITYMDRMYLCPAQKANAFEMQLRPSHFRHPQLVQTTLQTIEGNFTWAATVDDSWAGQVKMDIWTNNQWKENSLLYRIHKGYCSVVRSNWPGLYETFYHLNASAKVPCVFPGKKTFVIDNEPINWTVPNFPVLPYGRFRIVNTVWPPKKDKMACFIFEVVIVPKV